MPEGSDKPKIVAPDQARTVIRPGPQEGSKEEVRFEVPSVAAVMPLRNVVLFPGTVMPLVVGREKSRRLLHDVLPEQKVLVVVAQRQPELEDPGPDDLYDVGTAVVVLKLLRNEDGTQTIIVHGLKRVHIDQFVQSEPFFRAQVTPIEDTDQAGKEVEARLVDVRAKAVRMVELAPNVPDEAREVVNSIPTASALTDFLAANLPMSLPDKQALLAEPSVVRRLEALQRHLYQQVDVLELSGQIQQHVRQSIDKAQREYFLREQLKAIQKELGQTDEQAAEVLELRQRVEAAGMSEAVQAECLRELGRLERIPPASPEYTVIRTYLEVMVELPWTQSTPDNLDINRARRILDEDHYDLERVKRRILEYLAVRRLAPESRGPVLCFVGPPGVGKTSLGQSIARALGRKFIRMSLGGMRDEAELRGHRRTYIGAMPGRIIQEIRKAGTRNPVFMLDELDKVGMDFRGDPTSALLEILDPAQNFSFQDHYLNVPFDLSAVMFIGTANVMATVPPALRDRMEIIEIPGYTLTEKLFIAKRYLLPRQRRENGLKPGQLKITDAAIKHIIMYYTREAGVRELERRIGAICRAMAARIAAGKATRKTVNAKNVAEFLGPREYESELALRTSVPGVATALAHTPYGGEIIFIEATAYPGKGQLVLTGQIGEVMRESAQAALSLVRSRAGELGIDQRAFAEKDIHVHVPAGAVPKDGPSAGVAMATAISSLMMHRPV
ncbi:MAG: endopeptidase La, partial [Planctomycetales bacterium 4484_123]